MFASLINESKFRNVEKKRHKVDNKKGGKSMKNPSYVCYSNNESRFRNVKKQRHKANNKKGGRK